MSKSALVLAAHGSSSERCVNHQLEQHGVELAKRGPFDEVVTAFHRGEPTFATVLDGLSADDVTVVPVMASNGYFCDSVLPRELAKNQRYANLSVHTTAPVGTHPRMASLVAGRVAHLLQTYNLAADATTLAIIGHGTKRHGRSRQAVDDLVRALSNGRLCAEVIAAFLDEAPSVETIHDRAAGPNTVVVPFLIGGGVHAMQDVPNRLSLPTFDGASLPRTGSVRGRFIVYDAPIGSDPGILEIIADLAGLNPFVKGSR
ncbi:MAG: hypothetical protein IIB60_03720 [Planctomycetes bacterium]|nr:hypothetical protein [Planctomycetota bacterium]